MERPLFDSSITHKLYNERSVMIGTFIGGPLVAGYLIAQNFKALDQPGNAKRTWGLVVLSFLIIIASAFIPVLDKVPAFVYSAIFCILAHSATRKFQGKQIVDHQANGGQLYSTSRAAGIGFISLVVMMALILGLMYLSDPGADLSEY